jgi:hypothetical protein
MSLPISVTPTLFGKEARKFIKLAKENETKKLPKEEVENCLKTFRKVSLKNPNIF